MLKQVLSAMRWLSLAAHYVQGPQKSITLGELWPEVAKNYPGINARKSSITAAEFNEKSIKNTAFPQPEI